MVKEKISRNVVKVKRKSDRAMAVVLTLGKEVISIIFVYGPQSERLNTKKVCFYDEMASEWYMGSSSEIILSLWGFQWTCREMC